METEFFTRSWCPQFGGKINYPYRFSYFHHEAVHGEYVLVDVKEPWYHDYLRAMEDVATLPTKEERVKREEQLYEDLKARLKRAHESSSESL